MTRGFSIVALDNPKNGINVGSALRAAHCYDAAGLVVGGRRLPIRACTDPQKAYRHLPVFRTEDVFDSIPFDCVPIAVELVENARNLADFTHPERGFYIFGAEDQTLGKRILDRCVHTVYIPTEHCMNLAATVNVVLYDRMVKRRK